MKSVFQAILLAATISLFSIQPGNAFKLEPISRTFKPVGSGSTQSYEIFNPSNERVAINISMVHRLVNKAGQESHRPADDDFLVYPPQILLEPNAMQTVRVTWVGESEPTQELAYRLIAEQLPINLNPPSALKGTSSTGKIKVLMRYVGSVYIKPEKVKPDVVLAGLENMQSPKGDAQLALTFHNQGTAHASLRKLQLRLIAEQGEVLELTPEQMGEMKNATILAGKQRQFRIPYPANLNFKPVKATFTFQQPD